MFFIIYFPPVEFLPDHAPAMAASWILNEVGSFGNTVARVLLRVLIIGRRGRGDQCRIHNRATRPIHTVGQKQLAHIVKQCRTQLMLFQEVTKVEPGCPTRRLPAVQQTGHGRQLPLSRLAKQFKIDAGSRSVILPKKGWIRYFNSRDILGTPRTSPYRAGAADGSC
jgi:hypothetical protein